MKTLQITFKEFIKKKFVLDGAWLIASNAIFAICGILLNIVITQYFNADGFGKYSLALRIYMVAALIASIGTGASVVKHVAEYKEDKIAINNCVSSALLIAMLFSIPITGACYLILPVFSQIFHADISGLLNVFFFALPLFALNKVFAGLFNGIRDIKALAISQAGRWILLLMITGVLINRDQNLENAIWAFPITEAILCLSLLLYSMRYFRFSIAKHDWIKKHFSFGSKSMTSTAVVDLYSYLDVFMIGIFLDVRVTGVYSFASDIAKNLLILANMIQINLSPIIAELWAKKRIDELRDYIRRIKKVTYLLYIPLVGLAIIAYSIIVEYFLKQNLQESIMPFIILSIGVLVFSGYKPFAGILELTGFPADRLRMNLATMLINFILNLSLIHYWGISGVALATSVSYIFLIVLLNYYTTKRLGLRL